MVQKLNRLFGRADFRVLVFFTMLIVSVAIGWTYAQLADESNTIGTYEDLINRYLADRESSYRLAVPSWYLDDDQMETIEKVYGLAGFQNQPDWFVNFDMGDLYFVTNSLIAGLVTHGAKLIIYEDMVNGELLVVRDTGTNFVEEIVFQSLEWPDIGNDSTSAYRCELSKRRVVWHVTLKNVELAEEEYEEQLAAQQEEGGMMMLMSGGSCSEIVFTGIEKQETNDIIDVGLCVPDGITNVDVFVSTNLMMDGYPWVMVATNLPVVTNSIVWSWTNVFETNVFFAAADGSLDSDGDGLTDGREFYLYGTDMNLWDTDGDSYSDGEELQWGTDPLDVQNMPQLGRGVVINEILYNPSGTDAGKEWVELFNTNRVHVDLSGFRIQVASNAFGNMYLFPSNTILNSGDFLLVGGSSIANADYTVELNMPNRFSFGPTAGVRLITPDAMSNLVVDVCLYAPTNSFGLPTEGFGTDGFAPWAAEGFSVVRIKTGYDSDQASDWTFTSSPTPTASGELLDIDGDGISNASEIAGYSTAYGFVNTDYNNADTDFDGFSDGEELTNSPPTNPHLYDTDGDAFPWTTNGIYYGNDGDEVHNMGTDPTNPDSDGDGLPDGWEIAMGYNPTNTANGTADADADFDGDGVSNIDEMNQNSNPTDSNDFVPHDYRMVLYHFPQASWQPGDDMGTKTWVGYRFDNVIKTTSVAFVIADGGHTAETFEVSWNEDVIYEDQTGGRTNIVWAILLPGTSPELIITDGGTTWPNQNPAERGADLSIDRITLDLTSPTSDQKFQFIMIGPSMPTVQLVAVVSPQIDGLELKFVVGSPSNGRLLEYEDAPTTGYLHPEIIESDWLSTNTWDIEWGTNLFGGHVTHVSIMAKLGSSVILETEFNRDFYIVGDALTSTMRNNYIDSLTSFDPEIRTMAKAIAIQESGGTHYWTSGGVGTAFYNRYPLRETSGSGGGYGVMQLTSESLLNRDTIWNWKRNIDQGIIFISNMYVVGVAHLDSHTNAVTDTMRRLEGYNSYNGGPGNHYHWWSDGSTNNNGVAYGWTKFGYITCSGGSTHGYRDYNNDSVQDADGNPYNIPSFPGGPNTCVGRAARYADQAISNE